MTNDRKRKVIVILGPTASGKTALAIKIAQKFGGEIVSADSRQIYRGMDIGTAKPPKDKKSKSPDETSGFHSAGIPHYLIDIKNPNQSYTVAQYKKDAVRAIKKIIKKKKLPILAGGTGLYLTTVVDNLEIPEVKPDSQLRKKLEKEMKTNGIGSLFEKLVKLDAEAAYIVDPRNPRRVIRALEIALVTKKPFSAQRKKGKPLFRFLKIGVNLPADKLRLQIENRADKMIKNGLVKEVEEMVKKYGGKQTAFDAIGYREIIDYLEGKITLEESIDLIKKKTLAFAKRQMTWFKRDEDIIWIEKEKGALASIKNFLS